MSELLHFMGEHPILTVILVYCVCETTARIGIAFCRIFWHRRPKPEARRIIT